MTEQATVSKTTQHVGLVCRHCVCRHFHALYTRRRNDEVVRLKRCRNCDRAITTREKMI